ncbi:hypothetical protein AB0N07_35085 [Streptomyces sp. NPDC051172]|uniref:hypothetical protein n=1 Tax=Streptomyces sp. NPDC051172 TaxID=3155796 RepID=UPI003448D0D3
MPWAKEYLDITLKTVRRPPEAKGFVVLPRRWAVEHGWAWITRARRHCRERERLPEVSEALIMWAAITSRPGELNGPSCRRACRRAMGQAIMLV